MVCIKKAIPSGHQVNWADFLKQPESNGMRLEKHRRLRNVAPRVVDCCGIKSTRFSGRQKFFALLSKDTVRKSLMALLDQGVLSVANFLTGLIIGRMCNKEQFGLYMLGFTIITFAMNFQGALISTPYTIISPRLKGEVRSRYAGSTLVHQVGLSLLAILFLVIAAVFLSLGFGPPGLLPVVESLGFTVGFILLWDYVRRVCLADLRLRAVLVLDCCVAFLQVGGLLLIAYFGWLSASCAYWAIGFACGIATLGVLIPMRRQFSLGFAQALLDFLKNFSTGRWILASGLIWTVSTSIYPWLLAAFYGTETTGVWAACHGVIALCNPLFMGMQNLLGPKIAHSYAKEEVEVLRRFSLQASMAFGGMIVPLCIALLIFGEPLVSGIYGSKYAGNGLIVSVMALNLIVTALTFSPSRALFCIERADVDFKINCFMVFCLFSFGILLVKSFGIVGAATGLLLSNAGCLVIRYMAFFRLVNSDAEWARLRRKPLLRPPETT